MNELTKECRSDFAFKHIWVDLLLRIWYVKQAPLSKTTTPNKPPSLQSAFEIINANTTLYGIRKHTKDAHSSGANVIT